MEFSGLTDLPGNLGGQSEKCRKCGCATWLRNGSCLNCLLASAIEDPGSAYDRKTFKEVLASVQMRDDDWRVGNYRLLEEIGRGGMGVIYRAQEWHSRRIVALKRVLSYHADADQILARFRREAETAAHLDHPNIVPIYFVGEDDKGLPFFAMKFVGGGNLLQAREIFRKSPRASVQLVIKVAIAIQYAHDRGVLHRDLKPSNIVIDSGSEPMVTDFGLAKWLDASSDLTQTLMVFGTAGYIAPEQAHGRSENLTVATDIYSLGAILFELLSGQPPFLGAHALSVIQQSLERPAPLLRSLAPHLDRDLETICSNCLDREPDARYSSAAALADDLRRWIEGRAIQARPLSIAVRLLRWIRRSRRRALVLAALLALFCVYPVLQIRDWNLQNLARENVAAAHSVVVVPFFDLDNASNDDGLARSLAQSLRRELNASIPSRVEASKSLSISQVATGEIEKVGQYTNARTVLSATRRRVQGKSRLCLRLLDTSSGNTLFVRTLIVDDPGLSETVSKQIAPLLSKILGNKNLSTIAESRDDPGLRDDEIKDQITAGRQFMSRYTAADYDAAIALFRKAAQAQPNSSIAHSCLSIAAAGRTHYNSDPSFLTLAEVEARKAVELAPHSSDAHRALAGVYYQKGEFSQVLEEQLQAIELGGLEEKAVRFVALTLDMVGRPQQAVRWYEVASKLTRIPGELEAGLGDCWAKVGNDGKARAEYGKASELRPNLPQGLVGMSHLCLLERDFDNARALCRKASTLGRFSDVDAMSAQIEFFGKNFKLAEKLYGELARNDPEGGGSFYGAVTYRSAVARAKQALGDNQEATKFLKRCLETEQTAAERQPENPEVAYRLAAVEASLQMPGRAIEHLRRSIVLGWTDYRSLTLDPRFDSVRMRPDFKKLSNDLQTKITMMQIESRSLQEIALW